MTPPPAFNLKGRLLYNNGTKTGSSDWVCMQTGNSPTMISKEMMMEMLPRWDRTVRAIHADLEADKALGWAQEMFAFSLALANHPSGPPDISYHQELMAQPPFDRFLKYDKCQVCPDVPAVQCALLLRAGLRTCTLESM